MAWEGMQNEHPVAPRADVDDDEACTRNSEGRRHLLRSSEALATSEASYLRKIEPWRKELGNLKDMFLAGCSDTCA